MPVMLRSNPFTGQQEYVPTIPSGGGTPDANTGAPVGSGIAPDAAAGIQQATAATSPDGTPAATPLTAPSFGTSYDPSNPGIYQDQGSIPGVSQPVSAASGLPPEQEPQHLGATSPVGAGAYVADKLFRGYLQGRAVSDIRKAVQLQKTTTGLNSLYHSAAENLYNLAAAGVDPNSDQFKDAQNQAQSAWQAQVDFLGQHVQAQKTNKQGKQVPDQGNLLQRIFKPNDPSEVAPALYEAMQKTGPPVMHQIAPFLTPQYQAKVQQRAATGGEAAQTAQIVAGNQATLAQNKAEFDTLQSSKTPLTPEQEARKQQLYSAITMNPGTAAGAPNAGQKWLPVPGVKPYEKAPGSGQFFEAVRNPTNGVVMDRPMPIGFKPTPNAFTVGKEKWSKDASGKPYVALFDPQTNQELPGTQNYSRLPPLNLVGRITSSTAVDANGDVTTKRSFSGPAAGPEAGGGDHVGANPNAPAVAAAGSSDGHTVSPDASLQTHPGAGTPSAIKHLPTGVPRVAAPVDPNKPSVAPSSPNGWPIPSPKDGYQSSPQDISTWAYRLNTGQSKDSDVPSKPVHLRTDVANYMKNNNILTVTPETAAQNNSEAAMRDIVPAIDKAIAALEPHKNEGGVVDSLKQRVGYAEYKGGINPGASTAALNQALGFIKVAGVAPWSKIGRGVQIMKMIQEHLPDPSVDSPGLAYEKLTGLKALLQQQQDAVAARRNLPKPNAPAAAASTWTPPAGAPDATKFPEGYILRNKQTKQAVGIAKGGKWQQPPTQ